MKSQIKMKNNWIKYLIGVLVLSPNVNAGCLGCYHVFNQVQIRFQMHEHALMPTPYFKQYQIKPS